MRHHLLTYLALFGIMGFVLGACIPAEAPKESNKTAPVATPPSAPPPDAAETKPETPTAAPKEAPAEAPKEALGEASDEAPQGDGDNKTEVFDLSVEDIPGAVPVRIDVGRLPDNAGFSVEGTFNLAGTIKPVPGKEGRWKLDASLTFPTSGYTVGSPRHQEINLPDKEGNPKKAIAIALPLQIPALDAVTTQAEEVVPVTYELDAPKDTEFALAFTPLDNDKEVDSE